MGVSLDYKKEKEELQVKMVTVKRNGIYISYPSFIMEDGKVKEDLIAGRHVEQSNLHEYRKRKQVRDCDRVKQINKVKTPSNNIVNTGVKKKCLSCGSPCWRSDVSYCWDCYKYQFYESR